MRYTIFIKFPSKGWFSKNSDIKEDFKSMAELKPYLDSIDETVLNAYYIDNVTSKKYILK